jgi:hypothetical protein
MTVLVFVIVRTDGKLLGSSGYTDRLEDAAAFTSAKDAELNCGGVNGEHVCQVIVVNGRIAIVPVPVK